MARKPPASTQQSKISFSFKRNQVPDSEKVRRSALLTKAGVTTKDARHAVDLTPQLTEPEPLKSVEADSPVLEAPKSEPKVANEVIVARTEPLTDAELDEILNGREAQTELAHLQSGRLTKPINGEMAPGERILHIFDVTSKYGPAMGITRLDRWNRAEKLGKQPPVYVKKMLDAVSRQPDYEESYKMSIFGPLQ